MNTDQLHAIAVAMVQPGRGILAADESSGTIKKRFDAIGVESTEASRRDYREMMFRSDEAMTKHISGVILYDETIWQAAKDGTPLVRLIEAAGSIPGIKVDEGTQPLVGCPGETITVGLDKLAGRLARYHEQGARFAKWRAVIDIADGIPTWNAVTGERPCARPLRRAVPAGRHRPDRRAGGAHGRRTLHRALRGGHDLGAEDGVRRTLRRARVPRGHRAEAQHDHRGQEERGAGFGRRGRARHDPHAEAHRTVRGSGPSPTSPAASRTSRRPRISTP